MALAARYQVLSRIFVQGPDPDEPALDKWPANEATGRKADTVTLKELRDAGQSVEDVRYLIAGKSIKPLSGS